LRARPLLRALEALAERAPSPIAGFVYGAGFEVRPELLRLIARRWPVIGNDAGTVKRIKAPEIFFAELDRLGVPHPLTVGERPAKGGGWLAKTVGGAGGSHIVPSRLAKGTPQVYYQQRVEGRAVSALFVGNGSGARVLGFSEQWTAPLPRSPWRYGGAVRPASLPEAVARQMISAVIGVTRSFKIKGLASADFMVTDRQALLLEINPRPGATLDIFDCGAKPLLRLHVEAVREDKLPSRGLKFGDAMASAIVYAVTGGAAPSGLVWPDWSADRPKSSERIDKNRPICTVSARAGTKARAKRLVEERICEILAVFQSVSRGEDGEQKRRNRRRAPDGVAKRQRQGGAARQGAHR
jgi:predicted ATP-grasp superfamily ATP-dependent carboligase